MKVTNRTAYATIGCDVQLSENDRLALGIELDKVTNWLEADAVAPTRTEAPSEAINNLVKFISKFAIRPSETNVFTDSPEDFKKTDETTAVVEQALEDNVITVDISNAKDLMKLAKIIYHATDASLANISDLFNSAEEAHISRISFKCTHESKEEILSRLINSGYTIVPNTADSLQLETYMLNN